MVADGPFATVVDWPEYSIAGAGFHFQVERDVFIFVEDGGCLEFGIGGSDLRRVIGYIWLPCKIAQNTRVLFVAQQVFRQRVRAEAFD
jgi:hypothetical protein